MRIDSDLIVDAGDVLTAARSCEQAWPFVELDRFPPDTLETAARLLRSGAHRALALADRYDHRAAHRRQAATP